MNFFKKVAMIVLMAQASALFAGNEESPPDNNKKFYITGYWGGLLPMQSGASFGYKLSDDLVVEATQIRTYCVFCPAKSTLTAAGVKKFWFSGSFYTDISVGSLQLESSKAVSNADRSGKTFVYFSGEHLVSGITLGNRWEWESGFFAGVDWLSLHYLIGVKKAMSVQPNDEADPEEFQRVKDEIVDDDVSAYAKLIGFHFGWAF